MAVLEITLGFLVVVLFSIMAMFVDGMYVDKQLFVQLAVF